jgi:signal transduction histidine kinase
MHKHGPTEQPQQRRLADFIRERSAEIMSEWESRVRRLEPARRLERPALIDDMPQFLDELCDYVSEVRAGADSAPPKRVSHAHALDRLELGYDISDVVTEYSILRECLLELAYRELAPARLSAEMPRLHEAIDLAISESVARFSAAHDRTLRALDRISEASLEQPDVLGFLNKLLGVLLETTQDVDVVKIMLREGEDLVVRVAAGGLQEDLERGFRVRIGEGLAGRIASERRPMMVPVAEADDVKSKALLKLALRALYGIPLLYRDEVIGVALMGSTTAYQFSDEDKLLFRTMTGRATAIIVQGQIHEREKLAREEAERLARQLEVALELRDQVMGVLSHDIRNPLGVIKISAGALQQQDLADPQARAVRRISTNADRIEGMIHDLLDYTRARGTGIPIHPVSTDLAELCKEIIDSMEQLHSSRPFRLKAEGKTQGEWDRERLLQVIANLLANAVQFGAANTPIAISVEDAGQEVELAVHNEGTPIPADKMPRLFEAFVRGDGSVPGHEQGLGLGLFIVKQIVLAHGGTVEVRSDETSGTTFTVRLPRRPGTIDARQQSLTPGPPHP